MAFRPSARGDGDPIRWTVKISRRPFGQVDGLPNPVPHGRERVRWIGRAVRAFVGSAGHARGPSKRAITPAGRPIKRPLGGRLHRRLPCYIRPSAPLSLSLFFSPLQFTLEWIRSSFGWTKSIHWLLIFGREKSDTLGERGFAIFSSFS